METQPGKICCGAFVKIKAGKGKGKFGTIIKISEGSSGIVLKIRLSKDPDDIIRVWEDEVEVSLKPTWLRPRIRCRIIDKIFKSGKFYNQKCTIQDVSANNTIVRLQTGQVLDQIREHQVETLIPSRGKTVMILIHRDQSLVGQLAQIIDLDDRQNKATIQYDLSYEFETVSYDHIAEYVEGDY